MSFWKFKVNLLWQNKDNNKSKKNKLQNKKLTKELVLKTIQLMSFNESKAKLQLKHHIVDWEYQNNNILVPELEAQKKAEQTFREYKLLGYIDKWNNIREDLVQYIV